MHTKLLHTKLQLKDGGSQRGCTGEARRQRQGVMVQRQLAMTGSFCLPASPGKGMAQRQLVLTGSFCLSAAAAAVGYRLLQQWGRGLLDL